MADLGLQERELTVLELLDRALDKGIVISGEITLSVANVDLVFLGLKALLCSVETAESMRRGLPGEPVERAAARTVDGIDPTVAGVPARVGQEGTSAWR